MPGGRARQIREDGFVFDMGPSWYWMPDVFERYFEQFGENRAEYYHLKRLDPSYKVFWPDSESDIPADFQKLKALFENWEPGAGAKLDAFLRQAKYKYEVGMHDLVYKPGQSVLEYLNVDFLKGFARLDVLTSIKKHINKFFRDGHIRKLLEFPVLFLGALPENTPALYSLMNYADICGGTWYPDNGMYSIVNGMEKLALELGVQFNYGETVSSFGIERSSIQKVISVGTDGRENVYSADVVVAGADYHFVETQLLPKNLQSYDKKYWSTRIMAPSCLIYYVGLNKKLPGITHHSLFFDVNFQTHADDIYKRKIWPEEPMFYVSATSVTDSNAAPEGCENLFFLIPVAAGLVDDNDILRAEYFEKIITRFENRIGEEVRKNIIVKKTYGPTDFVNDYNAFRGNAYGLANTLRQTGILKPKCKSKKVRNLFYTGQLTVPGPGVPPSLISGEIAAQQVVEQFGS